ncbi:PREDICTED: uncharacterized protein LOC108366431 [Rhagoletis zephyria]|uniref:uncharacterized protein LOC108366431 n=1 Tax=Rhagoletis zephyria TaxID=28612 RepID=UPI0008117930|nr:PREDICTED: uncharacterized protein LOC108366431 [Rhagoletis zephyria]
MGQQYWYYENDPTQSFDFPPALPLKLNLLETVKVAKAYPKRMADEETERKVDRTKHYMSELESYGTETPGNQYSPPTIQAIFKDALPADAVTPDRKSQQNLCKGLLYNPMNHDDSDFTRLY